MSPCSLTPYANTYPSTPVPSLPFTITWTRLSESWVPRNKHYSKLYRDSELTQIPENQENQFPSRPASLHCHSRSSRKLWAGSSSPGGRGHSCNQELVFSLGDPTFPKEKGANFQGSPVKPTRGHPSLPPACDQQEVC